MMPTNNNCIKREELPLIRVVNHEFTRGTVSSYGIIPYCKKTHRWFIVARRHDYRLVNIINGRYNASEIMYIIPFLTRESKGILKNIIYSFDAFSEIFNSSFEPDQCSRAYERLYQLKPYILHAMSDDKVSKSYRSWTWPKGKKEFGDSCRSTMIREFLEESGLKSLPNHYMIPEDIVKQETHCNRIRTETFRVAVFDEEFDVKEITDEDVEVSARGWYTTEEVSSMIQIGYIPTISRAQSLIEKY